MTMQKIDAQSPEAHSADLKAENIDKLRALFPELITEGPNGVAVNQDVLKQLVGDATVTDAEEKYGLNWHGKRAARQLALTPSTGTLLPCPDESVDWDTTQNLMIEGDNLEVLKLLQKAIRARLSSSISIHHITLARTSYIRITSRTASATTKRLLVKLTPTAFQTAATQKPAGDSIPTG